MKMLARQLFKLMLVVLAAFLGFTCVALFYYPSDPARELGSLKGASSTLNLAGTSSIGASMIGERRREEVSSNTSLAVLPREFQQQLTSGLILECAHNLLHPKYARFLRTLFDYGNQHNHVRSSRTLTWQCSVYDYCGGLGDRIRGVAYALLLAVFSRRRLVVFWEAPTEGQYLHPYMLNWTDEGVFHFLRTSRRGPNNNLNAPLGAFSDASMFSFHVNMDDSGKVTNDVSHNDMAYYQRVIASNASHVIISTNLEPSSLLNPKRNGDQEWIRAGLKWSGLLHLSPAELDAVVGIAFRYLFTIDDKVFIAVMTEKVNLGLTFSPYTALHLRTGFAGSVQFEELMRHPKLVHNMTKWRSALQCAQETADQYVARDSPIFLASDSDIVKDIAISEYDRIRTLRNELVHVDKLGKEPHVPEPTEENGLLSVWVDFLLLAQAKVLVRGESGYSWTAGLLCGLNVNRMVSIEHCNRIDNSLESRAN